MRLEEIIFQNVLVGERVANVRRIGRNKAKKSYCNGETIGIMPKFGDISQLRVVTNENGLDPLNALSIFCNSYRSEHKIKNKDILSFFLIEYLEEQS